MSEQIMKILACVICVGLILWGVQHWKAPEKIVRRKFPDAQTIPDLMIRNTKMKGITMACVGAAGVLYVLADLFGIL